MGGFVLSLAFLGITLIGYYLSIKQSKLEKDIRKNKLDYECFECKENFSINEIKCPKCNFVTIYGKRRSKYWTILPILGFYIFLLLKFLKTGIIS